MPSVQRPLADELQIFRLDHECQKLTGSLLERNGRTARTLLKNGPMRITLVAVGAGGEIAAHQVDTPISIQAVQGSIRCAALGQVHDLGVGQLLTLGADVEHAITSAAGGVFLLTVAQASSPASHSRHKAETGTE